MNAPDPSMLRDSLPYFGRDSDGAFVLDGWDGGRWRGDSVVAFRECKN